MAFHCNNITKVRTLTFSLSTMNSGKPYSWCLARNLEFRMNRKIDYAEIPIGSLYTLVVYTIMISL